VITAKNGYLLGCRFPKGDVVTLVAPSPYHVVVAHSFTEEELLDMLLDRRKERRAAEAKKASAA
jgi:hypothetical protein